MSWSGGKDSCLALLRALDKGISVPALATFVPKDGREFLAHPRSIIEKQARELNMTHLFLPVSEPYDRSYEERISELRDTVHVEGVITGDIDVVENHLNWIEERCSELGMNAIRPLWKNDRLSLMNEILERKIEARITWINHPNIPSGWRGRLIDRSFLDELKVVTDKNKLDLCGENGEYHTIVTNAPNFSKPIDL